MQISTYPPTKGLGSQRLNSLVVPHKHLNTPANSQGMQFHKSRPLLAATSNEHHGALVSMNASKETSSALTKKHRQNRETAKETQLQTLHKTKREYTITHNAAMLREHLELMGMRRRGGESMLKKLASIYAHYCLLCRQAESREGGRGQSITSCTSSHFSHEGGVDEFEYAGCEAGIQVFCTETYQARGPLGGGMC